MPNADNELVDPNATEATSSETGYAGLERRRPGRSENVSPELVRLLRHTPMPELFGESEDSLRAPTGIVVSIVISLVIWAGLYFGLRALFW